MMDEATATIQTLGSNYGAFTAMTETGIAQIQLDTGEYLEELMHRLKGEIFDFERKVWYRPPYSKPLINEKGMNWLLGILGNKIHRVFFLSNLNEKDINYMHRETLMAIIAHLYTNYIEYEITIENFPTIIDLVDHTYFVALKRALYGKEREMIRSQFSYAEVKKTEEEKKRSALETIFSRNK